MHAGQPRQPRQSVHAALEAHLVLPNYLDKIDRGGCDTFLSWITHKKKADELRKKCSNSGRQLLLNVEEQRKVDINDHTISSFTNKYMLSYYIDRGILAPTC